jgi:regulator of protease activity HflC (stomatin/prohibitin superfamily)
MPGLRELLSRFRAAGAPGAPGVAGMPVDRRADVTAELEPVFAALAATTAECERLRADGAAEAQRCLDEARNRAASMLARAEGAAPADRAMAAARVRESAAADLAAIEDESRAAAEETTRRAAGHLPCLMNDVVEHVRRDIAALGSTDGTRARPAS